MTVRIPDSNEFHPLEQFRGPAAILRIAHDTHLDRAFLDDAQRARTFRWWAVYTYLTKNADPAVCAMFVKKVLADNGLHPNAIIVDLEEGDGDQRPRQHAWLAEMAGDSIADWTYSGDYFARAHNLETGDRFWVAAYQRNEPTVAHVLWQCSDAMSFDGISAPLDGSVFNGSIDDLIAITGGGSVPSPAPSEDDDVAVLVKGDKSNDWFVTDLIEKRHVVSQDEANLCVILGAKHAENNQPNVLPQWFVDGLKLVSV